MGDEREEGWMFLVNSRVMHFFVEGRALCGRYMVLAFVPEEEQRMGESPGRQDCKACWRKAKVRGEHGGGG